MEWWAVQQAVPTIRALRKRAEDIRDAEIRRALARCRNCRRSSAKPSLR